MRKSVFALLLVLLMLGLTVVPAFADVHVVSQAACPGNPNAGATQSRDAPGRPDAPIPVTASGGEPLPNNGGGDGDPFCDVP